MPSHSRWTLNPRKWFGTISYTGQKADKNQKSTTIPTPSSSTALPRVPTTATTTASTSTRTIQLTSTISSPAKTKNNKKVIPVSIYISNELNQNTTTMSTSITQLQLPAFGIRRERISTLLPSTTGCGRSSTFFPSHTEPSIRKNVRSQLPLSIDTTRCSVQATPSLTDESVKTENTDENTKTNLNDLSLSNMSRQCLVEYPRYSANVTRLSSSPTRSSSSFSLFDDNDNSSSSGIYSDERQRSESKDTLSVLEVISVQSVGNSVASVNNCSTRPVKNHSRRPMSVVETTDDVKPQERQNSCLTRSHRSQSAEGLLNETPATPTLKSRQPSGIVTQKLEKRLLTNRSPAITLEKVEFLQVANDTYRLSTDKTTDTPYSGKNSISPYVSLTTYDESLRSANDEECYAALPRTSSTEQLNNNTRHQDLRVLVDECIRPMVHAIDKNRFTKNPNQRYKRTHTNNDRTPLNVAEITDKLLSSVDYSTYARYQRCC